MKIQVKLKEIRENVYIGELFMGDRVFMYSLNYPYSQGNISVPREEYFELNLKDEDGKEVKITKRVKYHLVGTIGLITSQFQDMPPESRRAHRELPSEVRGEFEPLEFLEKLASTPEAKRELEQLKKDLEELVQGRG